MKIERAEVRLQGARRVFGCEIAWVLGLQVLTGSARLVCDMSGRFKHSSGSNYML